MERRLSTIVAADVVGYSTKMGNAEAETLGQLSFVANLLESQVGEGGGRIFSRAGDGFLSEFASPVAAVQASYKIQRELRNSAARGDHDLQLRIGIHLADVVVEGENLLGDGVNIAARIEGLAEPGSVLVSQSVFDQVKRTAQLTFDDLGEQTVKNISEPIRVFRVLGELANHSYISGELETLSKEPAEQIHPRSIAVLPFANFSDDPEQEYFADGFSEDLITELSRFRDLFVISRNASFAFKGRNLDLREVGRNLGVAFCLEGSVRKIGSRVRITAQLINTQSGDHVWAEKYDCQLDELFDLQDELSAAIIAKVVGRVERINQAAVKNKKTVDMAAHDCLLRGLEYHRLGGATREGAEQAVHWFSLAIEKDPNYAPAYAWKACAVATVAEWTGEDIMDEILELGRRAVELDDQEPECHRIAGSLSFYNKDFDKAEYHFRRALELNPNHVFIVGRMGELYNFLGQPEEALKYQRRAHQLDPLLPVYCRELEAAAHYLLGEYDETVRVVSQIQRPSRRAAAYRLAAAVHCRGEEDVSRWAAELTTIDPGFTVDAFLAMELYKDRKYIDALERDLTQAGFPKS